MSWFSYDFQCEHCSHSFNELVKGTSGTPDECPACGSQKGFERLISTPAFLTTIVPSYPGSKRAKAGYQHTHNRPAAKKDTQVSMAGTKGLKRRGT